MAAVAETEGLNADDMAAVRAELTTLGARLAPRFGRREVRARVMRYLLALLSRVERKNSWQLAEEMGERTPKGVQRLLDGACWNAELVRDDLRAYVIERLGAPGGIGVVDESGFPKRGSKSVGVQRQYCGAVGEVANCQVGVFLAYVSTRGRAFVDRELFLPKEWVQDAARRAEAGVPAGVGTATKPELAQRMVQRARTAGLELAWVVADAVYGDDARFRQGLQDTGQASVLAVSATHVVWADGLRRTVRELGAEVGAAAWTTHTSGMGSQGERSGDWACLVLGATAAPGMAHWLLIRQHRTVPSETAYFRVYGPRDTTVAEMVQVEGARWAIEEAYAVAKDVVGMDQYEVRKWSAWYRQMTLSLVACAALDVMRTTTQEREAKKGDLLLTSSGP
jgi:SRSO17 transposase